MRNLIISVAAGAVLFASLSPFAGARGEDKSGLIDSIKANAASREGNALYHEGKYDPSRASYLRAGNMAPEKSEDARRLGYNVGATYYKEGRYDEAEKEFQAAAMAEDEKLREAAHYGLGNVYFNKGLEAQDIEILKKSVEEYTKALEINPDDEQAKFNIEVVRRHIKLEQEKQKNQPNTCPNKKEEQKQQGQERKDQNQQQNASQQQRTSEDDKKEEGEKKDEDKKNEEGKEEQKDMTAGQDGDTSQQPPPESAKPKQGEKAPEELSKEEAKRLLQAIEQHEKENMKKITAGRPTPAGKEKDW